MVIKTVRSFFKKAIIFLAVFKLGYPVSTYFFEENLKITTNNTPKELIEKRNNKRDVLVQRKKIEENYVESEKENFTLGIIKIKYSRSDFQKEDSNLLQLAYASQIFYGNFNTIINVYDGVESSNKEVVKNISLNYYDFVKGKDITLGNFYMRAPSVYKNSSQVMGASILGSKAKTGIYERGKNSFEGYAPEGSMVDLYRNGVLLDFQIVSGERYTFTGINSLSLTDNYSIRVYKGDGSFTEEILSLLMNDRNLKKNTWNYQFQIGENQDISKNSKPINYIGNISYGITNNITYEAGIYKLDTRDKNKFIYNDTSHSIYVSSSPRKFPFQSKITWYDEKGEDSSNHGTVVLEHKLKFFKGTIEAQYEDYSKQKSIENEKDTTGKVVFKKNFNNIGIGIGYSYETFGNQKVSGYSSGLNYSFPAINFSSEYEFKEYNYSSQDRHKLKLNSDIIKLSSINIILDSTQEFHRDWKRYSQDYGVKFIKKHNQYNGEKVYDFSLGFHYSNKNKKRFLTEFSTIFYLESIKNPFTSSKISFSSNAREIKNHKVGLELGKTILLEDITRNSKMKNLSNSWITGKVFIDENHNEIYDKGEPLVEGVQVTCSGKSVYTDKDGIYILEDISPNKIITLDIDTTGINPLLNFQNKQKYKLNSSTGKKLDIPLQYVETFKKIT